MFLPLAIALHTLDRQEWIQQREKTPTASEQAHLLRKQLPNTLCKVVSKLGVDISDPIPHLNTKDAAKKVQNVHMDVASQCQVPDCMTDNFHPVKVVRHAAMQLTHLSRDIQRYVIPLKFKIITNIHEQHQPKPFCNFISGLVGGEVPPSWLIQVFPNPYLVSPIPACISYSSCSCNDGDAINWRCGNCTRNKCRRRHLNG